MLPNVRRPMSTDRRTDVERLRALQRHTNHSHPVDELHNPVEDAAAAGPRTHSMSMVGKFKTVVIAAPNKEVTCPHCQVTFVDAVDLRGHIFQCRMDHGVDPLLPLHVLERPIRPSTTDGARNVGAPPSSSHLVSMLPTHPKKRDSCSARLHSGGRYASGSTQMRPLASPSDVGSIMRRIEGVDDIAFKEVISPRLSSRTVPSTPRQTVTAATPFSVARGSTASPRPASGSTLAPAQPSPKWMRGLLAHAGDGPSAPSKFFRDALHHLSLATAELRPDATSEERRTAWTLDLSRMILSQQDAAIVAKLLDPCRGIAPLPVEVLDLRGTAFDHHTAEEVLFKALCRHAYITAVVVDDTTRLAHRTGGRPPPLLDAALRNCAQNVERMRRSDCMHKLRSQAESYKIWEHQLFEERRQLSVDHSQVSGHVAKEEVEEREVLVHQFLGVVHAQMHHERKLRVREKKQYQRHLLEVVEARARGSIAASHMTILLHCCEQIDGLLRKVYSDSRERSRMLLRVAEREDAFRSKTREHERIDREAVERLEVEHNLEVLMERLVAESIDVMEQIGKQKARHKAFTQWKRRQREEVDQLVRQEKGARETIKNEEDAYFASGRDKLIRTIESILVRYASQREHIETGEQNVRNVLEKGVTSWMQVSQVLFESESRLIATWTHAKPKEALRLEVLDALPTLSIVEGAPPPVLLFGAATPGHVPPEPIPVFPNTVQLQLSMGADWQHRFHEATQRCKRSSQDEQAAFLEHMQALHRYARLFQDSYNIAFETALEDLRAAYMHPPTRMQLIMNPQAAASPKASVSPPFGSWTPLPEDLGASVSNPTLTRAKSKRKMSMAPVPLEPVTDAAFLELASKALKWRGAWHDRYSAQYVKHEKETILHASIEISFDEDAGAPSEAAQPATDVCTQAHRLLTSTSRSYYGDESLVVAVAPMSDDDEGSPLGESSDDVDADGIYSSTDKTSDSSPDDRGGYARSLRIEISLPHESGAYDDAPHSNPSTPRSDASGTWPSHRPATKNVITVDDIALELRHLLYRSIVDGANMQACNHVGAAKVNYSIAVTVASANAYYDREPAPDVFGYCSKLPTVQRHTHVVETRGSFHVGVVPSYFHVVPPGVPLPISQPPRVLVEKQMDEIVVFPQFYRVDGPRNVQMSRVQRSLLSEEALQGFAGGTLTIEVLNGSPGDRLSMRDDLPAFKLECQEKTRVVKTLLYNAAAVGEVMEGTMQSTKFVVPSNNQHAKPRVVIALRDKASPASRIGPDMVKMMLSRLRFHNFDAGPEEGARVVRVSLRAANGACSVLDTLFEVEGIDKPTELRIAHQRVTHRAPYNSCPAPLRGTLTGFFVPLFPQAVVFDEDTDRFSGGHLKLTLQNGIKGDTLVFVPDTRVLSQVDDMLETLPVLRIVDQNQVRFENRIVATMTEGNLALDYEWLESSSVSETNVLAFDFAPADDQCSIAAVQAILRHCAFATLNPGQKLPHNASQHRDVAVELQIQDNEQPTFINDTIVVKGAGHSLQLPDKAAIVDFKEGSTAIKVGNLDVSSDRVKPITAFGGGYILAYVADGYTDGDVIALKPDDMEYRVVEPKRAQTSAAANKNKMKATILKDKVRQAAVLERTASGHHEQQGGGAAPTPAPPAGGARRLSHIAEVAIVATNQRAARVKQDILFSGMSMPMATLQNTKCGGVLISFQKDTKKDVISRKHVTTMLRNLSFASLPNPSIGFKVLRVLFADDPAASPTQVLVGVRLESTDDVTEIRMKSPRKQCLQQPEANFPICPYGRCVLVDEDTEYLDGGSFTVQCIAGSSRGDFFAVVPPALQPALPLQRLAAGIDGFSGTPYPDLLFNSDERTFTLNRDEVGRVETTSRDGGVAELKISFARDPHGGKQRIVPLHLASYMMNSILFGNAAEKLRDTTRQFQLRIRDAENPVEGKSKLQLDLLPPHFFFQPAPSTTAQPAVDMFHCRVPVSLAPGSVCAPGARIIVQCDSLHENKSSGGSTGGSVVVSGSQSERVCVEILPSFYEEQRLVLNQETGDVCSMDSKLFVLRIVKQDTHTIAYDFRPSASGLKTKPITKGVVQALLRSVQLRVGLTLDCLRKSGPTAPESGLGTSGDLVISADVPPSDTMSQQSGGGGGDECPLPNQSMDTPDVLFDAQFKRVAVSPPPPGERRTSAGQVPTSSPGAKNLLAPNRSPRSSILSPGAKNLAVTPRGRSSSVASQAPDDDDDTAPLTIKWHLHDGRNLSQLWTTVVPRRGQ